MTSPRRVLLFSALIASFACFVALLFVAWGFPQRSVIASLEAHGGRVYYAHQFASNGELDVDAVFYEQASHCRSFWNKRFGSIEGIRFSGTHLPDLSVLRRVTSLKQLDLSGSGATDAHMASISELHQLESLNLYRTEISGVRLQSLSALPRLRILYLGDTNVTGKEAYELRIAMPNTKIYR